MRSTRRSRLLLGAFVMIIVDVSSLPGRGVAQSPDSLLESKPENQGEFHQQVHALSENLVQSLASAKAREDLTMQVSAFLQYRIRVHPLNYEQDPQFQKDLAKTYQSFVTGLDKINSSRLSFLDLQPFETYAFEAYQHNSELFDQLFTTNNAPKELVRKHMPQSGKSTVVLSLPDNAPKGLVGKHTTSSGKSTVVLSLPAVRRAMLAFSLIVYATDPEQWHAANGSSHFWPWCRAMM
jgi:hypothetical protein